MAPSHMIAAASAAAMPGAMSSSSVLLRATASRVARPTISHAHHAILPPSRAAHLQKSHHHRLLHTSQARRASQASQQYDSLYSASYRGQGAKAGSESSGGGGGGGGRPWYRSPTTIVLGLVPIVTGYLGIWQLKRLKWKVSLIEELEDKLRKAPLPLPAQLDAETVQSLEFRLVSLSGTLDASRMMLLGPRVRDGVLGYHVVVPLRRDDGGDGEVLVDRGFVGEKHIVGKGSERRLAHPEAFPSGRVQITALLPRVYPANVFTPANQPETNSWFHADAEQMARHASGELGPLSLPASSKRPSSARSSDEVQLDDDVVDHYTPSAGVASSVKSMLAGMGKGGTNASTGPLNTAEPGRVLPVYLQEVFTGHAGEASMRVQDGLPVGRSASIELRNSHAVYAATWFSLSAATTLMFGFLVRRGR